MADRISFVEQYLCPQSKTTAILMRFGWGSVSAGHAITYTWQGTMLWHNDELRVEIAASSPGWTEADIEGKIDALHKVTREAVVSVFAEAGQAGDLLPLLANIAVPTLLIRADAALGTTLDDAAWERAKQYLTARSRAVQINGATHNVHRSTFNAFMQVVNDFLSQDRKDTNE